MAFPMFCLLHPSFTAMLKASQHIYYCGLEIVQAVGPACFPFHLTLQEHLTRLDMCEIVSTRVKLYAFLMSFL